MRQIQLHPQADDRTKLYNVEFYHEQSGGSFESAQVIVPFLLSKLPIKSVIDVGCGVGAWLSVFDQLGVPDYVGLDGSHVDTRLLLIPATKFRPVDLEGDFEIERRFDLAMSLEVVEHIPHKFEEDFIKRLIAFGGETVEIKFGDIYVDGKLIDQDPIKNIFYYI